MNQDVPTQALPSFPPELAKIHCNICTDFYTRDDILFPFCGHPLCSGCLLEVPFGKNGTFPCPICRHPFQKDEPHRIYPQYSRNTVQEDASHIVSRMSRLDANSPPISFTTGASKLRKIQRKAGLEPDESERLSEAAERMKTVMAEMAKQIEGLNAKLADAASQVQNLSEEKAYLTEAYNEAFQEAQLSRNLKSENLRLSEQCQRLTQSLERSEANRAHMQEEHNVLLKSHQDTKMKLKAERSRAKAMAIAKRQSEKKKTQDQDQDDSLIIE